MTPRETNDVQRRTRKRSGRLLAAGGLVAVVVAAVVWFLQRPRRVSIVNPSPVTIMETIASSARVGGVKETAVGSQFAGTVEKLFVKDGDHVKEGQPLAVLKNDVTEQQRLRAEREVQTAKSQLALTARGPTSTELEEAGQEVAEASAHVCQASADLELARKDFSRDRQLADAGIISHAARDSAEAKVVSGQNQRCAIIRALTNRPKIVLADEPTGDLDSRSGGEVFKMMREMNRESGVAFIMVTHDERLAQEADRILVIEDGLVHQLAKSEHPREMQRRRTG